MLSWILQQQAIGISQFDREMSKAHPDLTGYLTNATDYVRTIGSDCNYLQATEMLDWNTYLTGNMHILDLGCGGGWLSANLSKYSAVEKIYALDSSKHFLEKLLPNVIKVMGGDAQKIEAVEAFFTPLLFEDSSLDLVAASSSVHHAENLEYLFSEIARVLKPNGRLILLNETPRGGFRYLISAIMASLRILKNIASKKYYSASPALSSTCFLYDPKLGDRDYPMWYWGKALDTSGFVIEEILNTDLPTIKDGKGRSLIHFICKKVASK